MAFFVALFSTNTLNVLVEPETNGDAKAAASDGRGRNLPTPSVPTPALAAAPRPPPAPLVPAPPQPAPPPRLVPLLPNPKKKALVIGLGSYGGQYNLPNARNDGRDIAAELQKVECGNWKVTSLSENDCTNVKSFTRAVDDFCFTLNNGDDVLLYFAGHGSEYKGCNRLMALDGSWYSLQKFYKSVGAKARQFVSIIDACRSSPGRASPSQSILSAAGMTGGRSIFLFPCESKQKAYESKAGSNGRFTEAVLHELRTNPDGRIDGWFERVTAKVLMDCLDVSSLTDLLNLHGAIPDTAQRPWMQKSSFSSVPINDPNP